MVLSACKKSETPDNGLGSLSGTVWYGESDDGQLGLRLSFMDGRYCRVTTGALDEKFGVNVRSFVYEKGYGVDLLLHEYDGETRGETYFVGKFGDDTNSLVLSRTIEQIVSEESIVLHRQPK